MSGRRPGADKLVVGAGIVACAACCVGPLLAVVPGLGLAAALASGVAAIRWPLMAVVAVTLLVASWWVRRRIRNRNACRVPVR